MAKSLIGFYWRGWLPMWQTCKEEPKRRWEEQRQPKEQNSVGRDCWWAILICLALGSNQQVVWVRRIQYLIHYLSFAGRTDFLCAKRVTWHVWHIGRAQKQAKERRKLSKMRVVVTLWWVILIRFALGNQQFVLGAAIRIHHGAALVFLSIWFEELRSELSLVGFVERLICPGL